MREAPTYRLRADVVQPKRLFIMRADINGVVHWALKTTLEIPGAVPWCYGETSALLPTFWRGANRYDHVTCFWCMNTAATRCRR